MYLKALNSEEIIFHTKNLINSIVKLEDPFKKPDFIVSNKNEIIIEEEGSFFYLFDHFKRVLEYFSRNTLILLKPSLLNQNIYIYKGYELCFNALSKDKYIDYGNKYGFGITGIEYYACDSSYSWVVIAMGEVNIVIGDSEFMNVYFGDEQTKKDEINFFLRSMKNKDKWSFDCPDHLLDILKYKIDGEWVEDPVNPDFYEPLPETGI